jgi:adenylyltransferase/sulfurtransferase
VIKIIASLEVSEAVRLLTGREPCLVNKLLYVDLDQLEFSTVQVAKAASCPVCGNSLREFWATVFCVAEK